MPALTVSLHPFETPAPAVSHIDVGLGWAADGALLLAYHLHTRPPSPRLQLPERTAVPQRADGLWQHSCCELFVGNAQDARYREFNFSPSGDWAAYDFSDYRQRAANPAIPAPAIRCENDEDGVRVHVRLPAAALPEGIAEARIGLSCVIATDDGGIAYWALHHPAEKPDFHHAGGWTLLLPSAQSPRSTECSS